MSAQLLDPFVWVFGGLATVYSLGHGWAEATGRRTHAPSVNWQVPANWVQRRWSVLNALIWGGSLGPGFLTRNPLAGFWTLLMVALFVPGATFAALVGAGHGFGRALGISVNQIVPMDPASPNSWQAHARWRVLDGYLLLLIGGCLVGIGLRLVAAK